MSVVKVIFSIIGFVLLALLGVGAAAYVSPSFATAVYAFLQRDNVPAAPHIIAPDLYHVGTKGIASFLIDTGDGLILIDAGYKSTVPAITQNIETLDFNLKDVKILLNTHGHMDHAAGMALMKEKTGAMLYASPHGRTLLEAGGRGDFAFGNHLAYAPIKVDRVLQDGDALKLGAAVLTPHFTPGHTKGCTSWSMTLEAAPAVDIVLFCSLSVLNYNLGTEESYGGITADFMSSFEKLAALPCDIFLVPHGRLFDRAAKTAALQDKTVAQNPFVDPEGCQAYLENARLKVEQRIK